MILSDIKMDATGRFKEVALSSIEKRKWDECRVALAVKCPAFTSIFYNMLNNAGSSNIAFFTEDVPIAATDGTNIVINPKTFFRYHIMEQLFIVAHEIMHAILNHLIMAHHHARVGKITYSDGETLPYDSMLMNIAQDLIINDILVESNTGKFNSEWLHDKSIATGADSCIDVYRKLYKKMESKGGKPGQPGNGGGSPVKGKSFDEHLKPGETQGKDPNSAAAERNERQWQNEVNAAMTTAKLRGKLPGNLQRLFEGMVTPAVSWQEYIQSFFARKIGSGGYDFRRGDKRLMARDIFTPRRSGFGCGLVVVGIDTSGSIGAKELTRFFAELAGIIDLVKPKLVAAVWCDADVNRVDYLETGADLEELAKKKAPGGGGTDFRPVFKWIEQEGEVPDALVYLTDGYGSFPSRAPEYPVLWGDTCKQVKYPFGEVVDLSEFMKKG